MGIRKIPKQHATRSEELAANSNDRYFVDLDGQRYADGPFKGHLIGETVHFGIRDRATGRFDPRPTLFRSEVYDEVSVLNGATIDTSPMRGAFRSTKISEGKLRSSNRKVRLDDLQHLTPTQWFERLVEHPSTVAELENYIATQRPLSKDNLLKLLAAVSESNRINLDDEKLLDNVSQQLRRKLGIRRGDSR